MVVDCINERSCKQINPRIKEKNTKNTDKNSVNWTCKWVFRVQEHNLKRSRKDSLGV